MPLTVVQNTNQNTSSYSDAIIKSAKDRFFSHDGIVKDPVKSNQVQKNYFNAVADGDNFIVYAPDQRTANEVLVAAQSLRKSLANDWLGNELPKWNEPLVIGVFPDPNKLASGSTTYTMVPGGKQFHGCIVEGTRERIMDSVLPHELTHAVLTSHFPDKNIPRWADEGAATFVEHKAETRKIDNMLVDHLTTSRGIPFSTMFGLKEYPPDMLPLYSQGHSLTKFLIKKGDQIEAVENDGIRLSGKQRFIKFLERGMESESDSKWTSAIREYYGNDRLGNLQTEWNKWVENSVSGSSKSSEIVQAIPQSPIQVRPEARLASNPKIIRSDGPLTIGTPLDNINVVLPPSPSSFESTSSQGLSLIPNSSPGEGSLDIPRAPSSSGVIINSSQYK
jgi:hypothetical protein